MFDDSFSNNLPDDPVLAGRAICEEFLSFHKSLPSGKAIENYDGYVKFLGLFSGFCAAKEIVYKFPNLTGNIMINIEKIYCFFRSIEKSLEEKTTEKTTKGILSQAKEKYTSRFSGGLVYAFSDGDLKQIQNRINELRKYLSESELFDEDHRRRLIIKLENFQAELHKKMSSLDVFWGLFGEAGVALGKLGKEAKPFTDRIQDIVKIGWRAQARAEELSSDSLPPLLNEPSENQIEEGQSE